jgi:hypothetical protein
MASNCESLRTVLHSRGARQQLYTYMASYDAVPSSEHCLKNAQDSKFAFGMDWCTLGCLLDENCRVLNSINGFSNDDWYKPAGCCADLCRLRKAPCSALILTLVSEPISNVGKKGSENFASTEHCKNELWIYHMKSTRKRATFHRLWKESGSQLIGIGL